MHTSALLTASRMASIFSGPFSSTTLNVKSPKVAKRLTIETEPKPSAEALLRTRDVTESSSTQEAVGCDPLCQSILAETIKSPVLLIRNGRTGLFYLL